jgi:hypothetical protein
VGLLISAAALTPDYAQPAYPLLPQKRAGARPM